MATQTASARALSPAVRRQITNIVALGAVLTINALSAATEVFIPLQPHFFALQGLSKLFETTALVTRRLNRELSVSGIILCLYETGTRLASDVTDDLMQFLRDSPVDAPWSQATVFGTKVRRNIKLAEAPSFGQSIFDYAGTSNGAEDYAGIVRQVLRMGDAQTSDQADGSPATVAFPGRDQGGPSSLPAAA